jgi:hypothetical protein
VRHELRAQAEVEQTNPEADGQWAEYQHTGRAQLTCSCGYDSGTVPKGDASRLASNHVGFDVTKSANRRN